MTFFSKSLLVMLATSVTIVAGAHVAEFASDTAKKLNQRTELNCRQINEVMPGGCTMPK